jgi:flavin reductase (DIM6/NTAB) family NADH-FMN oxidoreductase RutF
VKLVKKILNKFNGLHYQQEYLCLSMESLAAPLRAYIVANGIVIKDVTGFHLFVGYHPLVLAFPATETGSIDRVLNIAFAQISLTPNEPIDQRAAIAWLRLLRIASFDDRILLYKGTWGAHRFVSTFHQIIIQIHNNLYNRREGNVFLKNNLYKQVQVAYSIPRKICLVTLRINDHYNLFPTDLHGEVADRYIISLRANGKACEQVLAARKIVVSDIRSSAYRKVYALGKNHMQPPKEQSHFGFNSHSRKFNLPLPEDVLFYRELELENSITCGIHRLLLFRIVFEEKTSDEQQSTLGHIHNCYATWRYNHKISSNLLLR